MLHNDRFCNFQQIFTIKYEKLHFVWDDHTTHDVTYKYYATITHIQVEDTMHGRGLRRWPIKYHRATCLVC